MERAVSLNHKRKWGLSVVAAMVGAALVLPALTAPVAAQDSRSERQQQRQAQLQAQQRQAASQSQGIRQALQRQREASSARQPAPRPQATQVRPSRPQTAVPAERRRAVTSDVRRGSIFHQLGRAPERGQQQIQRPTRQIAPARPHISQDRTAIFQRGAQPRVRTVLPERPGAEPRVRTILPERHDAGRPTPRAGGDVPSVLQRSQPVQRERRSTIFPGRAQGGDSSAALQRSEPRPSSIADRIGRERAREGNVFPRRESPREFTERRRGSTIFDRDRRTGPRREAARDFTDRRRDTSRFDRPLHAHRPSDFDRRRDRDRRVRSGIVHHHHYHHTPTRPRTRFSVQIGAHFGPPVHVVSPFKYHSIMYGPSRFAYHRSVYVAPSFYYAYPHYYIHRPYTALSFTYGRPYTFRKRHSFLFHFRFGHVPVAHTVTLVRPAVVHVVQPAPVFITTPVIADSGWFGSTSVGTTLADDRVGVVLPEPRPIEHYPSAEAERPVLTTGADLGNTYLQLGDAESALRVLMHHLSDYPNDSDAIRSIGLAYLLLGEGTSGVRQIGRAYRLSPWLAARPLPADFLSSGDHGYALDVATHIATETGAADAWLAVAVLMQMDERYSAARTAIQRAKRANLPPQLVERFEAVLPHE